MGKCDGMAVITISGLHCSKTVALMVFNVSDLAEKCSSEGIVTVAVDCVPPVEVSVSFTIGTGLGSDLDVTEGSVEHQLSQDDIKVNVFKVCSMLHPNNCKWWVAALVYVAWALIAVLLVVGFRLTWKAVAARTTKLKQQRATLAEERVRCGQAADRLQFLRQ